jgi:hypothetical protein
MLESAYHTRNGIALVVLIVSGCFHAPTSDDGPMFKRAIIRATKLKYVPAGTELTVDDPKSVNELEQFFVPDRANGHERSNSMSVGSITFIDEQNDKHGFNVGLFEWSQFGSDQEYPLPPDFHSRLKEIIERARDGSSE